MLVIDDLDGAIVERAGSSRACRCPPGATGVAGRLRQCRGLRGRAPAPVLPGDPTWTSRDGSMSCTARSGELLDQNGDVPRLAVQALAATARSFVDIAELDFCRPSQKQAEIDIIALADGR